MQNNTHPRPLGDTVLIALEAKQHDMQDAITGFVSRVARIREDMKSKLDTLLVGKSKEQVEQAFQQAEAVTQAQTEASQAETQAAPKPSKRSVGAKKHGMPVAPQIPKAKEVKILPVGEPLVGEMTEEEIRRVKGDKRDPGEL